MIPNECRASFYDDENGVKLASGDDCIILGMY